MKKSFILVLVLSMLFMFVDDGFARAGKGRSSKFRSYDTKQFNYKNQQEINRQTQTPSYQQAQPSYNRQPQLNQKPSFLNSSWFKWLVGGMIFGALLSLLLGHGFNFGMPGLLEILLIIGVVYLLFRLFKKQQPQPEYATQTNIGDQSYGYSSPDVVYGSSTIPNINEGLIINLAKSAFTDIQKAWSEGDLSKVRNFMTDRMYNYLESQLKDLREKGLRNIVDNLKVENIEIVHVEEEKDHKVVVVNIKASAVDYTVDKNGDVVEGNPVIPVEFSEYWAFVGKALDWRLDDIKQIED